MQNKHLKEEQRQRLTRDYQMLNLSQEELKKFDFNKYEYEYFIENCNFTDRQKEVLDLRRKGKSIVEITFITNLSEATVYRELKKIKRKIYKFI